MKISIDDKELFTLTDAQKQVIMNDIHEDEFYNDMCRRIQWAIMHKYDQCFKRLKDEWDKKLAEKVKYIPTDAAEYTSLVMSQPEYKARKERESLL